MQEEIFEQQDNEESLFTEILFLVRKNIILILAIVFFVTSLGVAYALVRKPNYTAEVAMRVSARSQGPSDWKDGVNTTQNYLSSIVDFCDEGVVIDRANYYYSQWLNEKRENPQLTLTAFMDGIDSIIYNKFKTQEQYILPEKISVDSSEIDGYSNIVFHVNYTDKDEETAIIKAQILVAAIEREALLTDSENKMVYFQIVLNLENKGMETISVDISKLAIVFISGVLGVAISLLALYLKTLLDKGIKTKEELERFTGAQVLSCIDNIGGNKDGRK